jgi:hypothetical protein
MKSDVGCVGCFKRVTEIFQVCVEGDQNRPTMKEKRKPQKATRRETEKD